MPNIKLHFDTQEKRDEIRDKKSIIILGEKVMASKYVNAICTKCYYLRYKQARYFSSDDYECKTCKICREDLDLYNNRRYEAATSIALRELYDKYVRYQFPCPKPSGKGSKFIDFCGLTNIHDTIPRFAIEVLEKNHDFKDREEEFKCKKQYLDNHGVPLIYVSYTLVEDIIYFNRDEAVRRIEEYLRNEFKKYSIL